ETARRRGPGRDAWCVLPCVARYFERSASPSVTVFESLQAVMNPPQLSSPEAMTPAARAAEITAILAAAIVRTLVASELKQREVGLGFLPDQRVHTTPYQQERL